MAWNCGQFLPHRVFVFAQPVWPLEDLAGLGAIGCTDNSVALHQVDEVRGAAIPDAQSALQQGSGSLAVLQHDAHCILEEFVVIVFADSAFAQRTGTICVFLRSLQEVLLILCRSLRLPELDDCGNFFLRHKWRMDAMYPR